MALSPSDVMSMLHEVAYDGEVIRGSKHACAIVYKKRLLSIGTNKLKTHPMMGKFSKNPKAVFLHAEIHAIVQAINRYGPDILKQSTLYVTRLTAGNKVGDSKPCSGCAACIDAFQIKHVVHT